MTNIILLAVSLLQSNAFPYGATDEYGGWGKDCCTYNVTLTYTAPTSGVYVVEYNYYVDGAHCNSNGCYGMRWTTLNCGGLVNGGYNGLGAYPTEYSAPRGYYTNYSTIQSTNTIILPVPYWDRAFFRLKKVREA